LFDCLHTTCFIWLPVRVCQDAPYLKLPGTGSCFAVMLAFALCDIPVLGRSQASTAPRSRCNRFLERGAKRSGAGREHVPPLDPAYHGFTEADMDKPFQARERPR